jgi:hypothetical protein
MTLTLIAVVSRRKRFAFHLSEILWLIIILYDGGRYFTHCSSILHGAGQVAWWYAFLCMTVVHVKKYLFTPFKFGSYVMRT